MSNPNGHHQLDSMCPSSVQKVSVGTRWILGTDEDPCPLYRQYSLLGSTRHAADNEYEVATLRRLGLDTSWAHNQHQHHHHMYRTLRHRYN